MVDPQFEPRRMTAEEWDAWTGSPQYLAAMDAWRVMNREFTRVFYARVTAGLPALGVETRYPWQPGDEPGYIIDPRDTWNWHTVVGSLATYPGKWTPEENPTFMWVRHLRQIGDGAAATVESQDVIDLPYFRNSTSRDAEVLAAMALAALAVSLERIRGDSRG
jgi:hypothetical protein